LDELEIMSQQAIEDYLKHIYQLAEIESPVGTTRLADSLSVKPASVTNMMKKLADLEYVNYEKSRGVTLTAKGRDVALEIVRHHRLIELYLTEVLGFGWDEVHEQAELLEHVISEKLEERIAEVLGHPTHDPHGDPIPTKKGQITVVESVPLSTLTKGSTATITRVRDNANSGLLSYLAEIGVVPGVRIEVFEVAPFDGPLTLTINDGQTVIGFNVAQRVQVQVDK